MKLRTLVCAAAAVLITACSQEPDVVTDADNEFRWGDVGEKRWW